MTGDSAQSIKSWTLFWRSGSGASCFESADTEVRLTQVWDEFVDKLPDGARLLDLATGNGTVARCCAARARGRNVRLRIEAVDAAEIDPPSYVADPAQLFREVRFRGGVRLEALPFPDGAFDGIVSQFGFEYADEDQATAEAVRNLAPGGRLRLIMHARDGAVSRDIGKRLKRLQSVLAENGPVTLVLTMARAADTGDVATLERKSAHLAAATELARRLADRPPPDDAALFYSREFLKLWSRRERYWASDLRRSVEEGWTNANGVAIRQEQMLRVARSAEDMARIGARFAAADLILDGAREIRDDRRGVQIAWMMDARKPSNAQS
jgi:SAM-dependent methyltransferase